MAHGDYCDVSSSYVLQSLDFSSNPDHICKFVKGVRPTGGGDSPECYELVLHKARDLRWQAGKSRVLVVIGDDVPHPETYPGNTQRLDWRNEAKLLHETGINVYGIHAMPGIRQHSRKFYQELATLTDGHYLTLDQFSAVNDLICAVCYKQSGIALLQKYQHEVEAGKRMTRNAASIFNSLGEGTISIKIRKKLGLEPVPSGRFQVLGVDRDASIRDFVENNGLPFARGKGFYELRKTEVVQEFKEVILRDDTTGDMYSGEEARKMIGLPWGTRGKVAPHSLPPTLLAHTVFVQSTSNNRRLLRETEFLYEVED